MPGYYDSIVRREIHQALEDKLKNLTPLMTLHDNIEGTMSGHFLANYLELVKPAIANLLKTALYDSFCDYPQDFYAHLLRYQVNYESIGISPINYISFNSSNRACAQVYDTFPKFISNKKNYERIRLICGSSQKTMNKIIY